MVVSRNTRLLGLPFVEEVCPDGTVRRLIGFGFNLVRRDLLPGYRGPRPAARPWLIQPRHVRTAKMLEFSRRPDGRLRCFGSLEAACYTAMEETEPTGFPLADLEAYWLAVHKPGPKAQPRVVLTPEQAVAVWDGRAEMPMPEAVHRTRRFNRKAVRI